MRFAYVALSFSLRLITSLAFWWYDLSSRSSVIIFVLRKKGSETKETMKEEEIKKGDCRPPTRFFFEILSDLNQAVPSWRMVRWCIRLTRLTLVCEVIRYRLAQVRLNLMIKKRSSVIRQNAGFEHLIHIFRFLVIQFRCGKRRDTIQRSRSSTLRSRSSTLRSRSSSLRSRSSILR